MKRRNTSLVIAALSIMLLCGMGWARMTTVMVGQTASSSVSTPACSSPSDASLWCEDFEGTTACGTGESLCRAALTNPSETGGTLVAGVIAGTNACNDKGTNGITITKTGANEDLGFGKTISPTKTRVYSSFMYRPISGGDANGDDLIAFVDSYANWGYVALVRFFLLSGNYRLYAGNTGNPSACGATDIAPGAWVHIAIDINTNATSTVYLNGVSQCTFTAGNLNIGYIGFGSYHQTANYSLQVDSIKVNESALSDSCAE